MIRKVTETIVAGAIGLAALYAVARVSYEAGQQVTREEYRYYSMKREREALIAATATAKPAMESAATIQEETEIAAPIPVRRQSKLGLIFGIKNMLGNHGSVVGRLAQRPEDHKIEAFVEGEELHINVKKKE